MPEELIQRGEIQPGDVVRYVRAPALRAVRRDDADPMTNQKRWPPEFRLTTEEFSTLNAFQEALFQEPKTALHDELSALLVLCPNATQPPEP